MKNKALMKAPTLNSLTLRAAISCILCWLLAIIWRKVLDVIFGCTYGCTQARSYWIGEIGFWTLLPILLCLVYVLFVTPLRKYQAEKRKAAR